MLACIFPYTLIALGQQSVDSGLAAILDWTTPLFVCLIAVCWTKHEPITAGRLSGALVGLGGVVLIVGASAVGGLGTPSAGQGAILLAAVSSAASVIHGRRFVDIAPELVAAGTLTSAAAFLIPLSVAMEAPWQSVPSAAYLTALFFNAIGATALGFAIYFRLIRTVGSMGTASAGYLKPITGAAIGVLCFGEVMTWTALLGLIVILAGVAVINSAVPLRRRPAQAALGGRNAKETLIT